MEQTVPVTGTWTYRSYRNTDGLVDGDPQKALALIFGEGRFTLVAAGDAVTGRLDMGGGYVLDMAGEIRRETADIPYQLSMTGRGRAGTPTAGWQYDYIAYPAAQWPDGVDQVNALVGTVIRSLPHNGEPAGVTASFVMVAGAPAAARLTAAQAPGFQADILPKFRPGDITCMAKKGIQLADPAWMRDAAGDGNYPDHANARRVFDALSGGFMPPDAPWPQDWIALYGAWMGAGFQP